MLYDSALLRDAAATLARTEAEIAYNTPDSTRSKVDQDALATRLKATKTIELATGKQRKMAEKSHLLATGLASMDSLQQSKNVKRCWQGIEKTFSAMYPIPKDKVRKIEAEKTDSSLIAAADTLIKSKSANKKKGKTPEKASPQFKSYQASEDVMLNPPQQPCLLARQEKDEFSGEIRKETQQLEILHYTNPILRNYLQGKHHIVCEVSISSAGPLYFLNLFYTIQDPSAKKSFGGIAKNSILILKFVDGTTLSLYNQRNEEGSVEPGGQIVHFKGQYEIDKTLLKKIRSAELDKIRMAWNTGYEDYDVQQIDLLMRLSKCL